MQNLKCLTFALISILICPYPEGKYMFKINNKDNRTMLNQNTCKKSGMTLTNNEPGMIH